MNGIFRDVYLLKRPERAIWDYHITTQIKENTAKVKLNVTFDFQSRSLLSLKTKPEP